MGKQFRGFFGDCKKSKKKEKTAVTWAQVAVVAPVGGPSCDWGGLGSLVGGRRWGAMGDIYRQVISLFCLSQDSLQ